MSGPVDPSEVTLVRLPNTAKAASLVYELLRHQPHAYYQGWGSREPTLKSVREVLGSNAVFGIMLHKTQLVGIIGFVYKGTYFIRLYNGQYWVHYIVDKEQSGRGIATIALAKLLDVIREETNIKRVYAGIFSYNPSSIAVVKKLGFIKREERAQTEVFEKIL